MLPRFQKPATCADCALAQAGRGHAPTVWPTGASILFYGEALGEDEVYRGEPFVGAAGGVFSRVLARTRPPIQREHVGVGNCIACQPPGNFLVGASYEFAALSHCRPHVDADFARPGLKVVVPMGATAIRAALGLHGVEGIRVNDFHGTVSRDPTDRFWVVPTFHPSHLQRGAMSLLETVTTDIERALSVGAHGFTRMPFVLVVDPPPDWFDRWVDAHLAALAASPDDVWLALDTEYLEKAAGQDESEVTFNPNSPITRVNVSNRDDEGVTVPYTGPYKAAIERLLAGVARLGGYVGLWNKYADLDHLRAAGHTLPLATALDLMWGWHRLQSDLPRGLGFVSPFYSDFGAWKHWAKQIGYQGEYAAADGLQTFRCMVGIIRDLTESGLWDVFIREDHERDLYVLRPSHDLGVPIDRPELEAFHADNQAKLAALLVRLSSTEAAGTLKPPAGYSKKPKYDAPHWFGACVKAKHETVYVEEAIHGGPGAQWACRTCGEAFGISGYPTPPASILGVKKGQTDNAKTQHMLAEVILISREVRRSVRCCRTCGAVEVTAKHRCPTHDRKRTRRHAGDGQSPDPATLPGPDLVVEDRGVTRWFWQLPFNPDARAQILAYIDATGQEAPIHRKTKKVTTDKGALKALAASTGDPFYQLVLDWKAVQKVDSTYAVATLRFMDANGRIHPEVTFAPSTGRDSSVGPNLQNVVADKTGVQSLAAGFRRCIHARRGIPSACDPAAVAAWRERYKVPACEIPFEDVGEDCRLLEVDFSGIENLLLGWLMGSKTYIEWGRRGLHAAVTATYLKTPASLTWPEEQIRAHLKAIKHANVKLYDDIKHVDHGTGYGLTPYGMAEMYPERFKTPKEAEEFQRRGLFTLAPEIPVFHNDVRKAAKDNGFLGGPQNPRKPWRWAHPFGYRHWFWDVLSYKPTDEVTARKWLSRPGLRERIVMLHGRYFKIVWGGDSKRVIAFFPQSIGAGVLKRAQLLLFADPTSPDYIGDAYFGMTPLLHPIHDSLLLIVPCVVFDRVLETVVRVMQEPIPQLPCPPEWGIGPYLRIGVSAKASAPGGNWAPFLSEEEAAVESAKAGRIIRPNLLGMQDLDVPRLDVGTPENEAPGLPIDASNESEMEVWESLQRTV